MNWIAQKFRSLFIIVSMNTPYFKNQSEVSSRSRIFLFSLVYASERIQGVFFKSAPLKFFNNSVNFQLFPILKTAIESQRKLLFDGLYGLSAIEKAWEIKSFPRNAIFSLFHLLTSIFESEKNPLY